MQNLSKWRKSMSRSLSFHLMMPISFPAATSFATNVMRQVVLSITRLVLSSRASNSNLVWITLKLLLQLFVHPHSKSSYCLQLRKVPLSIIVMWKMHTSTPTYKTISPCTPNSLPNTINSVNYCWNSHKASLIISAFWNIVRNSLWNIIFETKFLQTEIQKITH